MPDGAQDGSEHLRTPRTLEQQKTVLEQQQSGTRAILQQTYRLAIQPLRDLSLGDMPLFGS